MVMSLILSALWICGTSIYAAEGYTKVVYERKETLSCLLTVSVEGKGIVFDGEETIDNQIKNEYQLKIDANKKFKIIPNKGAKLEKITLDGIDITGELTEDSIEIFGKGSNQELIIYFDSGDILGVTNEQEKDKGKSVKTGDFLFESKYVYGLFVSLCIVSITYKRKREREIRDE